MSPEMQSTGTKNKISYPRKCAVCGKIYQHQPSWSKHLKQPEHLIAENNQLKAQLSLMQQQCQQLMNMNMMGLNMAMTPLQMEAEEEVEEEEVIKETPDLTAYKEECPSLKDVLMVMVDKSELKNTPRRNDVGYGEFHDWRKLMTNRITNAKHVSDPEKTRMPVIYAEYEGRKQWQVKCEDGTWVIGDIKAKDAVQKIYLKCSDEHRHYFAPEFNLEADFKYKYVCSQQYYDQNLVLFQNTYLTKSLCEVTG